jgi:4-hydroxybenzoate polyprenyltransferase
MIETLLNWLQPVTVLVFIVAGILSLLVGKQTQGAINLALALCNFVIFYGFRILGK